MQRAGGDPPALIISLVKMGFCAYICDGLLD